MALLIGAFLALAAGLFATWVGLDRDRAFYPTVTIVIAFLYVLFAVIGESSNALASEFLAGTVFAAVAVYGFKSSLWIVAAALVGHGLYDLVHGMIITNPGVPPFWPAFCGTYDIVAGGYLTVLIKSRRIEAAA